MREIRGTAPPPLYWACERGLETVALRLLETGVVDVNVMDTSANTNDVNPLLCACEHGFETLAMKLLERGCVDLDQKRYQTRSVPAEGFQFS